MDIEIANRFQGLRKKHGLSQEELAARIGVSRQAVSKWERGEASPDTDNLILLSQLYGISLDELLKTESVHLPDKGVSLKKEAYGDRDNVPEMFPRDYTDVEIYPQNYPGQGVPQGSSPDAGSTGNGGNKASRSNRSAESFSERYENCMGKLESGLENGMDRLGGKIEKSMDKWSARMDNSQHGNGKKRLSLLDKTLPLIICVLFAAEAGIGLAHPGWTVFLLLPLYYTFTAAARKKNPMIFCYPVLCAFVYFSIGGIFDQFFRSWSDNWYCTMWVMFLTIPLYYTGYYAIKKRDLILFCYPVLALMGYLGIGMFLYNFTWRGGDKWMSFAWIPFLVSIPFYYIVILHFRSKRGLNRSES